MKLGIMQPYFFPYIGYYELIAATEKWVVFDIAQFTPKSWMTRNRILHPGSGWQYISVECSRASQNKKIYEIRLLNPAGSRDKLLGQLAHYKKRAPHFKPVCELVREAFDRLKTDSLTELNICGLSAVCAYLDIPFSPLRCSEMRLPLPAIEHPGQWALEICSALGASHYINPPGGRELFKPDEFASRNIRLSFTELRTFAYECSPYVFEPHLSILDALMWNAPDIVRGYLETAVIQDVA